ncbi:hypothetical protein Fot_21452 [Forsythia ovata]|uniref:Uncharacterized protein n=1 Tax=Forsythia ovata TaxID=205694 RepID=A0ABD1UUV5_9LAMI
MSSRSKMHRSKTSLKLVDIVELSGSESDVPDDNVGSDVPDDNVRIECDIVEGVGRDELESEIGHRCDNIGNGNDGDKNSNDIVDNVGDKSDNARVDNIEDKSDNVGDKSENDNAEGAYVLEFSANADCNKEIDWEEFLDSHQEDIWNSWEDRFGMNNEENTQHAGESEEHEVQIMGLQEVFEHISLEEASAADSNMDKALCYRDSYYIHYNQWWQGVRAVGAGDIHGVCRKDYRDIYGGDNVHDSGEGVNYTWRADEYKRTGRANCSEYWQGEEGNTAGQTTSSSRRPSIPGAAATIKFLFSSSFKATSTNNNYNFPLTFPLASAISLSLFLSFLIFRRWRRVKDSGLSVAKSSWVPFSTMSKSTMKTSGSSPQLQQ